MIKNCVYLLEYFIGKPLIHIVSHFQVLHIDNNQLSVLPNEIGCLINLQILSVSSNKLSVLPLSIGQLHKLVRLDIRRNNLNSLPSTICRLRLLEELLLDDEREWIAPPTAIVKQRSIRSILSYFAPNDSQGRQTNGDVIVGTESIPLTVLFFWPQKVSERSINWKSVTQNGKRILLVSAILTL